jgi:hypothetical protein
MEQPETEILWKQYEMHVELYKHYLDVTLKLSVFNYAVSGAILSFFFSTSAAGRSFVRWALVLPIAMNLFLAVFFAWASTLIEVMRQDVFRLRTALKLQVAPDIGVLRTLLLLFAVLYLLTSLGTLVALCKAA